MSRVILVDYDGPLARNLVLDKRALGRLKELAEQDFRIAIVTGRSPQRIRELARALEESNLWAQTRVFCEHGSIEVERIASGQYEARVHGELTNYQRNERKIAREELLKAAEKHGFSNALVEGVVSLYFGRREVNFPLGSVRKIVGEAVEGINASGRLKTRLMVVPTAAGIEVLPAFATKRLAAEKFLAGIRKPYAGFAFGDRFLDMKMARDANIKFFRVNSPEEFLARTEKIGNELKRRQGRLAALRRRRERLAEKRRKPAPKRGNSAGKKR